MGSRHQHLYKNFPVVQWSCNGWGALHYRTVAQEQWFPKLVPQTKASLWWALWTKWFPGLSSDLLIRISEEVGLQIFVTVFVFMIYCQVSYQLGVGGRFPWFIGKQGLKEVFAHLCHTSIIHKSKEVEAARVFIDGWIDKIWYIHTMEFYP